MPPPSASEKQSTGARLLSNMRTASSTVSVRGLGRTRTISTPSRFRAAPSAGSIGIVSLRRLLPPFLCPFSRSLRRFNARSCFSSTASRPGGQNAQGLPVFRHRPSRDPQALFVQELRDPLIAQGLTLVLALDQLRDLPLRHLGRDIVPILGLESAREEILQPEDAAWRLNVL